MLTRAKKLIAEDKSQPARLIAIPYRLAKCSLNFIVQRVVCHHEISPKLKVELKKETSHALCGIDTYRCLKHIAS